MHRVVSARDLEVCGGGAWRFAGIGAWRVRVLPVVFVAACFDGLGLDVRLASVCWRACL